MKQRHEPSPHLSPPPEADTRHGRGAIGQRQVGGPARWLQQIGLLTAIPFVLLVGPVMGYYVGAATDRRFASEPWGMGLGVALGLIASARVTIQLIRQAKSP